MNKKKPSIKTAVSIITSYRKSLNAMGVRSDIVDSLDAAIDVLKSQSDGKLDWSEKQATIVQEDSKFLRGRNPAILGDSEILSIVTDEEVDRKTLERIAIERYAVPSGSTKSYPNVEFLREKLITLIRNDHAHDKISSVSRGSAGK